MKKISRIEPTMPIIQKRKRVAAYARVSKETERLMHSVSMQVSYYSELIQNNPEWEYVGVYADNFISGTGTEKRLEFNRLISDCEKGKIDIILTKSISRFARNTVDLLKTVRHLKGLGVEVRFEKENINSLDGSGELMLSILASFAQEESQSISENSKWGIRKRFQSGEIGTANKHLLGYRFDEEQKKYIIIPEEAKFVRKMFQMFIDGFSYRKIAEELNKAGLRSIHGNELQGASVRQMIFNEVYVGDIRRQKSFVTDPIRKNKILNHGELPQYYMTDQHEAIIDRDTYALVLQETKRRNALLNPTYCFTQKIKCGICGRSFTRKKGNVHGNSYVHWICHTKKEVGKTCKSENFSEDRLKNISAIILGLDEFDEEIFNNSVKLITVCESGDLEFQLFDGNSKLWKNPHIELAKHMTTITDEFQGIIQCGICGKTFHRVIGANKWVYWYCNGKKNLNCTNINYPDYQLRKISAYILGIDEFDGKFFTKEIRQIIAFENGDLEFHFYDGRNVKWEKV